MKNILNIIILSVLLSTSLHSQQRHALPFFVAYSDGKAYLLIVEIPKNSRGFNVYRSAGGDFSVLNAEPIVPINDPLLFREMLGSEYNAIRKSLKATNELQVLRRMQSDPGMSFAFSLTKLNIARACGRLFVDENVEEGKSYSYRVAYIDFSGKEFVTRERKVKMEVLVPPEPEDVALEAGDGKVKVHWRFPEYAGDETDLTVGFNIYRDDGTERVKINPLLVLRQEGELSRLDTEIKNGHEYSYSVTAVDFIGRESKPSSILKAMPKDATPPRVPIGLTATPTEGKITLGWKSNVDADLSHYDIYRGTSSQGEFIKMNTKPIPKEHPVYTDSGLIFGDYYFYKLKAIDSSGNESKMSASIPARPKDTKPPQSPSSLKFETTESSVTLRWDSPIENDVIGYYVYRGFTKKNLLRVVSKPIGKDTLEYRDDGYEHKGLWQGKTYYYAVSAIDRAQNESPKNIIAVTIPDHEPPRPPQDVNIRTTADGRISIEWQPSLSLDVSSYRIYRSQRKADPNAIADIAGFSFIDTHVVKGEEYNYQLTAVDSSKNESEKSPAVTIVPRSNHLAPAVTKTQVKLDNRLAVVTWEQVSDPELLGYNIYRSDHRSGEYQRLNTDFVKGTKYTDPSGRVGMFYRISTVTTSGRENNRGAVIELEKPSR